MQQWGSCLLPSWYPLAWHQDWRETWPDWLMCSGLSWNCHFGARGRMGRDNQSPVRQRLVIYVSLSQQTTSQICLQFREKGFHLHNCCPKINWGECFDSPTKWFLLECWSPCFPHFLSDNAAEMAAAADIWLESLDLWHWAEILVFSSIFQFYFRHGKSISDLVYASGLLFGLIKSIYFFINYLFIFIIWLRIGWPKHKKMNN